MRFESTGSRAASRPARSTEDPAAGASAGFTLLETLTALLILSIAMVSLFEAHAKGLSTAGSTADYAQARIFAQSLLAETTGGWTGDLASKKGTDGVFSWSVDVSRENAAWAEIKSDRNWRLHRVRVAVTWDGSREIVLETLKLGRTNE